ncbi:hypothetical protein [Reyranella sp.]|uniref:hypothetical protein n=1 Tax=Reyranella sp. TaxID=1929291 RepID=UPI003F72412E
MPQLHNIEIRLDDDESWVNWGKLIYKWHTGDEKKPEKLSDLEEQWQRNGIKATFKGKPDREVSVVTYDPNEDPDNRAFIITIPPKYMIDDDQKFLMTKKKYPIPDFYAQIYKDDPAKRVLSQQEMEDIGYARLGEYVINECM